MDEIIKKFKPDFEKHMEHYVHELSTVRTGRANPALLATVMVDVYGAKQPIEHIASVNVSDAKTLVISPWDKTQLAEIDKAIMAANLGFTPSNDGSVIRITLPPLTEERRREMVKLVGQIAEQTRVSVRQTREEVIKAMKREETEELATKDDVISGQKKLQDVIDKYNAEIKQLAEDKEQELMTV